MLGELVQGNGDDSTANLDVGSERVFLLQSFVFPGLIYPLWHFAGPGGPVDPLAVWIGLGLCFLSVPVLHRFQPLTRPALQTLVSALGTLVTLHLFLLASLNDMSPFYAIGSSLSVLATVFFIRTVRVMTAYSFFVVVLASALYFSEPDVTKLAYWGGLAPVVFLAYYRLNAQVALRRELVEQVDQRTIELSDTNQRLRSEIQRRTQLEEQLRVTQKMEAIGRLAGGVAHDFNNLLTTIGVYSELLLAGLSEDSPLRNEVKQILKANQQAAALTHQLLTLGRRSHVPFETIDLNEVIAESATMLRHLLGEDTRLDLVLASDPQPVWGNLDQLQQILINLCINSRDAMPGSGSVTLETRSCTRQELESLDLEHAPTSDEYVLLAVSDTGQGMDPKARERAFDPFFTTKDPDRGSGLGLSIVHGIVSQAGGHARLESEVGRGTCLELYWPRASSDEASDSRAPHAAGSKAREEILLVEDEDDLRDALHRVLHSAGYRVTDAANAEEALDVRAGRGRSFDLVITDVVMPNMSGVELAEHLLEADADARVLLVSGHLSDRVMSRMPSHLPFLAKPFAASELTERVRLLLDAD